MTNTNTRHVSSAQLHRLVYAGLIPKDRVRASFEAEDPRHDVDVWRAFARSTVLPLGMACVVIALALAVGASQGERPGEVSAIAFALGALASLIVGVVNAGKRALLPAGIALVVTALLVAGNVARVRALRREEEVAMIIALVLVAALSWALARTQRAPGAVALDDDAAHFVEPPSLTRRVGSVLVWLVGGPLSMLLFVALVDARDLEVPLLVLGVIAFVGGAAISRSKRPLVIARQAGLLAFVMGTLCLGAGVLSAWDLDEDWRLLLFVPVLVVGWLAVRSWPLRATWGAVLAAFSLIFIENTRPQIERGDDVFVVLLAALTTFALTRGRYVRPVGVAGALALLVFSLIEIPMVGAETNLALGTFTSLGATACAIGAALVVMRGASVAARVLVCAVLLCAGALYIEAPAIVLCALVLLLARQARVRFLEVLAFVAVLAAGWALVDKPWAVLETHAIKAALTAVVLLAIGLTLRRVPAMPPATAPTATTALPTST